MFDLLRPILGIYTKLLIFSKFYLLQIEYNFTYLQCPLEFTKKVTPTQDVTYEPLTTLNVSPGNFYMASIMLLCSSSRREPGRIPH